MDKLALFDIVSVALILLLGIKGVLRGFVKEFFAFVGIIGGIYFASRYALNIGTYLDTNFLNMQNKSSLYLIGFIVTFSLFWFFSSVLGNLLSSLVHSDGTNIIDKILGFFMSALKIFFIISVMIYILSSISAIKEKTDSFFKNSKTYPVFLNYGKKVVKLEKKATKNIEVKQKIQIKETNTTN